MSDFNLEGEKNFPVFWLTGLSGSGKSTLAQVLKNKFLQQHSNAIVLDGDELRKGLCHGLSFSLEDRTENIRRVAEVAKLFNQAGIIVISSIISPLISQRAMAKFIIGEDHFREVFVDCPIEVCEQRDPKGLYQQVRAGQRSQFTGIDSPYEIPLYADIHLQSHRMSVEEMANYILCNGFKIKRVKEGKSYEDIRSRQIGIE